MSDNPDDEPHRENGLNRSVVVIIPTYNERENLGSIVDRVRVSVPDAHVLVVDDNSPDGTGTLADELAAEDAHIHVLHRSREERTRRQRISPGSAGPWTRASAQWWRWTPTDRTSQSNCVFCWLPSTAVTW